MLSSYPLALHPVRVEAHARLALGDNLETGGLHASESTERLIPG